MWLFRQSDGQQGAADPAAQSLHPYDWKALEKDSFLYYVGEATSAELTAYLLKLVPRYMIPGEYRQLDVMPLTANCKINRKFLLDEANK